MECPRCGGTLTRYRLDKRETVGCQECAYVGVTVDHTATDGPPESWDDAIERFEAQGQSLTVVTRDDLPADVPESELPPEEALVNGVDDERVDDGALVLPVFEDTRPQADDGDLVMPTFEAAQSQVTEGDLVVPVFDERVPERNDHTEMRDADTSADVTPTD